MYILFRLWYKSSLSRRPENLYHRAMSLIKATRRLSDAVSKLKFSAPVTHVYNPLDYARAPHELYLTKYGQGEKRVIFLGMNPGPFGMAQVGIPFGEVTTAKDWLKLEAPVGKPRHENPKRPIEGFACTRSEVSGRRLWGLFKEIYDTPEKFFADNFVLNYCPLAFLDNTRNVTPDKLPAGETAELYHACDTFLRTAVEILQPEIIVGIGKYARKQAEKALPDTLKFTDILHPSPASPAANKGWAPIATKQLVEAGIWSKAVLQRAA